jgi:hypothetical protein
MEVKSEQAVDPLHELEQGCNLIFDLEKASLSQNGSFETNMSTNLRWHTEDMGIILHEPPHTGQPSERAAGLISVDDTKLGHPNGQFLVATISRVKDQAMTWAVHRLQSPLLLLNVKNKHVVLVVLPMPRGLPEFGVVHVGRDNYACVS